MIIPNPTRSTKTVKKMIASFLFMLLLIRQVSSIPMRLILFFWLAALGRAALCEPLPPHTGEWTFTDHFSYYRTTANYGNLGMSSANLPLGGYYSLMSDQLAVNY